MPQKKRLRKSAPKHKYESPTIEKIRVIKSQQSPMMSALSPTPSA